MGGNGTDSRKTGLFRLVVALCLLEKRAVTIDDIQTLTNVSQKTLRYTLLTLEDEGRVIKTSVDLPESERSRTAWLPVGRAVLENGRIVRSECEICGKRPRAVRIRGRELCRSCMRGFEDDDGHWIVLGSSEKTEATFSRLILQNEHHMACLFEKTQENKKTS